MTMTMTTRAGRFVVAMGLNGHHTSLWVGCTLETVVGLFQWRALETRSVLGADWHWLRSFTLFFSSSPKKKTDQSTSQCPRDADGSTFHGVAGKPRTRLSRHTDNRVAVGRDVSEKRRHPLLQRRALRRNWLAAGTSRSTPLSASSSAKRLLRGFAAWRSDAELLLQLAVLVE